MGGTIWAPWLWVGVRVPWSCDLAASPGAQTGGIRARFENLARAESEDAERQAAEEKERRKKREAAERQAAERERAEEVSCCVWCMCKCVITLEAVVGSVSNSADSGRPGMGTGARTL